MLARAGVLLIELGTKEALEWSIDLLKRAMKERDDQVIFICFIIFYEKTNIYIYIFGQKINKSQTFLDFLLLRIGFLVITMKQSKC